MLAREVAIQLLDADDPSLDSLADDVDIMLGRTDTEFLRKG